MRRGKASPKRTPPFTKLTQSGGKKAHPKGRTREAERRAGGGPIFAGKSKKFLNYEKHAAQAAAC